MWISLQMQLRIISVLILESLLEMFGKSLIFIYLQWTLIVWIFGYLEW